MTTRKISLVAFTLVTVLTLWGTLASPASAAELGLTGASPRWQGGIRVNSVQSGSLASELGLESGDVIVAINGSLINSLSKGRNAMNAVVDRISLLVINVRNGQFLQLEANIPAPGPVVLLAPAPGSPGKASGKTPMTSGTGSSGKFTILKKK